ncbi:hypothetical protein PFISCL1PPCAC_15912, partial [Pristionchus fissidentatus]
TRSLFCFTCYEMVDMIDSIEKLGEPTVKKFCDKMCDQLYGHLGTVADECKKWIDENLDEIMDKLDNGWSAERVCTSLHFCS